MIRRGLTPHALREFMISQGVSKNTTLQEWDKIWAINRRVIDPVAPRHTGESRGWDGMVIMGWLLWDTWGNWCAVIDPIAPRHTGEGGRQRGWMKWGGVGCWVLRVMRCTA